MNDQTKETRGNALFGRSLSLCALQRYKTQHTIGPFSSKKVPQSAGSGAEKHMLGSAVMKHAVGITLHAKLPKQGTLQGILL